MNPKSVIEVDVESVKARNADPECPFNKACVQAAWNLSYDTAIQDPILKAAASIYLNEYVPLTLEHASNGANQFACYLPSTNG